MGATDYLTSIAIGGAVGTLIYWTGVAIKGWIARNWNQFNRGEWGYERYDTALIVTLLVLGAFSALSFGVASYFMDPA